MSQAHWRTCWPLGFMSRRTTQAGGKYIYVHTLHGERAHTAHAHTHSWWQHKKEDICDPSLNFISLIWNVDNSYIVWIFITFESENKCIYLPPFFWTSLQSAQLCIQWQPEPWPWMLLQCDTCKKYPCLYSHNCPCKCQYLTFTSWHTVNIFHFTVYIIRDIWYVHSLNWGH